MGYTSTAVIAIHKSILAEDLISPTLPGILRDESDFTSVYETDVARYWVVDSWKWYKEFKEIKELEAFFSELEERGPLDFEDQYGTLTLSAFGAVRMGENNDDIQEWGDPLDYGIELVRRISHPNDE